MACVLVGVAGDDDATYMFVGEERQVAVGFESPHIIVTDEGLTILPGAPILETRRTGVELRIVSAHVIRFTRRLAPEPITVGVHVRERKGDRVKISRGKYQTLNGELFRVLGQKDGYVFFHHLRTKKVVGTPVAGGRADKAGQAETTASEREDD